MRHKNKFSISKKLFLITFVLIFSMLFQILFFEDFYLNRKVKDMIKEASKFSTLNSYADENFLTDALFRFEQETDSRVVILSLDGKIKFLDNYGKNTDDFQVLTAFCAELINDKYLINEVLTSGKPQARVFENKLSNTKKIGIVSPM
ncbi:two-component sensor histidine kinase, partial [Clostridium perfringens]|nr:two-component sensor histidine kinase [Clostridium perfringens]